MERKREGAYIFVAFNCRSSDSAEDAECCDHEELHLNVDVGDEDDGSSYTTASFAEGKLGKYIEQSVSQFWQSDGLRMLKIANLDYA